MIREMRKIVAHSGGGWRFLLLLVLRSPFDCASTLIQAAFLQRAFDAVARNSSADLTAACAMFGVATLCLFAYNGTLWSVYSPFTTRMEGRLRVKLFEKIASLPHSRMESSRQGDWLTRLNADVEMPFSRPLHLPHAACSIVNIGVSAILLWRMHPAIFGYVMLFVIPHIAFNHFFIARMMPSLNKASLEAIANNTNEMGALIACADIAALYDGHDYLLSRFELSSLEVLRVNMRMRLRSAVSAGILPLFGLGGYLTLLIISSGWIAEGSLTFGELTAAFQYRGGVLVGSLMLINSMISIQASMAGVRRVNETMDEKSEA